MNNDPVGAARAAANLRASLQLDNVLPFAPPPAPQIKGLRLPRLLRFDDVASAVARLRPAEPLQALRPHTVKRMATWFVRQFPGDVLYAVKTNPGPTRTALVA